MRSTSSRSYSLFKMQVILKANGSQSDVKVEAVDDLLSVKELEVDSLQSAEEVWDEGAAAWLTILGGWVCSLYVQSMSDEYSACRWLALFASWGYTNAFGVYQDFYGQNNTGTPSQISWIGSTQQFFLIASGFVSGPLVDLGYFRQTLLAGSLLYVLS